MAGGMKVNPEELSNLGSKVENEASLYIDEVKKIYNAVDTVAWEGGVGKTYIDKVNSYKADLENLGVVLTNYANYLKSSAKSIGNLQDEVKSIANRL